MVICQLETIVLGLFNDFVKLVLKIVILVVVEFRVYGEKLFLELLQTYLVDMVEDTFFLLS